MNRSKGTLAVLTLALTATFPVRADASFELASYVDGPGGAQIAAGDYAAAVAAIPRRTPDMTTSLVAATNLCVALTKEGRLDVAVAACDEAVALADRLESKSMREIAPRSLTPHALSNRGVLRALRGDAPGAASDFKAAARGAARWDVPSRNLVSLEAAPKNRVAEAAPE
jgi:Flp pilus assembly protein TadD